MDTITTARWLYWMSRTAFSPRGNPLIFNLHVKLENFWLLLDLSTEPMLPPLPSEKVILSMDPSVTLLLRNPKHLFFRVFPCHSNLLHPSPKLIVKYPKHCKRQMCFSAKSTNKTPSAKPNQSQPGSHGVGEGWWEEEHSHWCCLYCASTAGASGTVWRAAFTRTKLDFLIDFGIRLPLAIAGSSTSGISTSPTAWTFSAANGFK